MSNAECLHLKYAKINDLVPVFAIDQNGPYIEGWAFIIAKCQRPHHYRVRFCDEKRLKVRFINPDWSEHPASAFALLVAFWQANKSPESFDDFFPDQTPEV